MKRKILVALGIACLLGMTSFVLYARGPAVAPGTCKCVCDCTRCTCDGQCAADCTCDGACDSTQCPERGQGYGPGDGTGNDGEGPQDGSGYGPGRR